MNDMIWFNDWFDVYNPEHMKAYRYFQKNGMWPEGFMPDNVIVGPQWNLDIRYKMADAWNRLDEMIRVLEGSFQ